jgi:hypothetical protein
VGAEADNDGLPVSLEGLPPAHLRVLFDGLPVFERYGLLLAGGYAFRAHEILHRPSQDLDFATRDDTPLPEIAGDVRNAFQSAGYHVELVEATGRYARLTLRLPGSGEAMEMDLLKEALDPSFVTVQVTAVPSVRALSLEDTVGLKARARIAAQAGADLGRVAGEVLADDLQAELAQDRGGGLALEKELERRPDEFPGSDVTAAKAGGKSGRHAHLVAGARRCLDVESAIGPASDGDLRHAVTLASRQSMHGWLAMTRHGCCPALVSGRTVLFGGPAQTGRLYRRRLRLPFGSSCVLSRSCAPLPWQRPPASTGRRWPADGLFASRMTKATALNLPRTAHQPGAHSVRGHARDVDLA